MTTKNTDDPFDDCKLGREKYADTIIDIINSDINVSEDKSFVMALDAPFGTGKTHFIERLKKKIKANNGEEIHVITYNAWENDLHESPIQALITNIMNDVIFDDINKKQGKKLLIIIDELDRCKPLFAIQTLEVIKHLFDIRNINFLLSVNFDQLKHSIATIYGQDMDSEGYLCRFISYIMRLQEPSKDIYVDYLLREYTLKDNGLEDDFKNDIKSILSYSELSLRDINAIYANFRIFFKTKFNGGVNPVLSLPYLILILFKYKDFEIYQKIIQGKITEKDYREKLSIIDQIYYEYKNMSLEKDPTGQWGQSVVFQLLLSKHEKQFNPNNCLFVLNRAENDVAVLKQDQTTNYSTYSKTFRIGYFMYLTNSEVEKIADKNTDITLAEYYAMQLEAFTTNM